MRVLLKTCLIGLGAIAIAIIVEFAWLLFNSRGLPDAQALAQFAPASVMHVSDPCLKTASVAIPYGSIGTNLQSALGAVEASEDDPGELTETYRGFTHSGGLHRATLSLHISRTMFCGPSKALNRQLDELRAAVQLERRFSRRELFTIFANRLEFGEDLVGVEPASQHFFHKEPSQLLIGDAALPVWPKPRHIFHRLSTLIERFNDGTRSSMPWLKHMPSVKMRPRRPRQVRCRS